MTTEPMVTRPPGPKGEADIILRATKVTKQFEGLVANREIDFDIPRHSIVSMIGPNGAGKTTFFNQLSGVYHPTDGTIDFDGVDISRMAPHEVAELGVARTYQNIRLFRDLSALTNVSVGQHVRTKGQWYAADSPDPGHSSRGGSHREAFVRAAGDRGAAALDGRCPGQEPAVRGPAPA